MERDPFFWITYRIKVVIFHSYVKLPEGSSFLVYALEEPMFGLQKFGPFGRVILERVQRQRTLCCFSLMVIAN